MRTFSNGNNRKKKKHTRKEVDFRSVRVGKRVELLLAWAWDSREDTRHRKHKEMAAAQAR